MRNIKNLWHKIWYLVSPLNFLRVLSLPGDFTATPSPPNSKYPKKKQQLKTHLTTIVRNFTTSSNNNKTQFYSDSIVISMWPPQKKSVGNDPKGKRKNKLKENKNSPLPKDMCIVIFPFQLFSYELGFLCRSMLMHEWYT